MARRKRACHASKQHFTVDDSNKFARDECEFHCTKTKLGTIINLIKKKILKV